MRKTTYLHIAFRNIGDSNDGGKFFEGSMNDCMLWMLQQFAGVALATRIVVGAGRSREDAERGIHVAGAGRQILPEDAQAMIDKIFADSQNYLEKQGPDDNYEADPADRNMDPQDHAVFMTRREMTKRVEGDTYEG